MSTEAEARSGQASTSGKASLGREEDNREIRRIVNAIVRGAGVGLCIRGGLNLLSWVLALFSRARRNRLALDPFGSIFEQVLDTLRYTAFLGCLSGIYVGADEAIANHFGRQRHASHLQETYQYPYHYKMLAKHKLIMPDST